jgi:hypothetical protein
MLGGVAGGSFLPTSWGAFFFPLADCFLLLVFLCAPPHLRTHDRGQEITVFFIIINLFGTQRKAPTICLHIYYQMANTTAPPPHLGLGLAAAAAAASGPEMSAGSPASAWGAPAAKWVALAGVAALVAGTALYVVGTSKVRVKKGRVRNTDYAPPPPFARPGTPPPTNTLPSLFIYLFIYLF